MASVTRLMAPASGVFHHYPEHDERTINCTWEETTPDPFEELIVSWNAQRPTDGDFRVSVMIKTQHGTWSSKIPYMEWGHHGQKSFNIKDESCGVHVFQDCIDVVKEMKATAFRVEVESLGNANLSKLWALHAYTKMCSKDLSDATPFKQMDRNIDLLVPKISQMALTHPRAKDLCSPTSTTAVIRYLSKCAEHNPIHFAAKSIDEGFDIYGNWVLNVVQASHELGSSWECWVARLNGFEQLMAQLSLGIPVIVSVRGPLTGGALPYAQGHLLVVKGYDVDCNRVLCMDPGFPFDDETYVSYDRDEFVQAWSRRGLIAYQFNPLA